jgi:hypothetical protein
VVEWGLIPYLPVHVILTDRDDGTLWHLTFTEDPPAADGHGYISINDSLPGDDKPRQIYPAYSEPFVTGTYIRQKLRDQAGRYRLIVRGGYLGVDFEPLREGRSDRGNPGPWASELWTNALRDQPRRIILMELEGSTLQQFGWTPLA